MFNIVKVEKWDKRILQIPSTAITNIYCNIFRYYFKYLLFSCTLYYLIVLLCKSMIHCVDVTTKSKIKRRVYDVTKSPVQHVLHILHQCIVTC